MRPPFNPARPHILVEVNGDFFRWTPEEGLDSAAVLNLDDFICNIAWHYRAFWFLAGVDREDLLACGQMGALKAARRFDPSWGAPFIAYAKKFIKGEILQGLGTPLVSGMVDGARAYLLQPEAFVDPDSDRLAWDVVEGTHRDQNPEPSPVEEEAVSSERMQLLEEGLRRLPEVQRTVLERRLGLGGRACEKVPAIAASLGLTRYAVEQQLQAAMAALTVGMGITRARSRARRKRGITARELEVWMKGGNIG